MTEEKEEGINNGFPTSFPPLPQNKDEIIEKKKSPFLNWKNKEVKNLNNLLKENKIKFRVLNINYILVSIILLILILGSGVGSFIYFTYNGNFSPIIIDNSSCVNTCPIIPSCPAMNCPTQNINVTFTMPKNLNLNVLDVNFTTNTNNSS